MREVKFRVRFDNDTAARVRFNVGRKQVFAFTVQLECFIEDEWRPIVRYDTAHGFAHRDVLRPGGETEKTRLDAQDYNTALTLAINDLRQNWAKYRLRYEQWLREKQRRKG